jgi:hypothetical protein
MRTEKLELDERFGNEYAGCCVFQEISWAKRSRIIHKYTKYHSHYWASCQDRTTGPTPVLLLVTLKFQGD